jgi:hypothetical protein
VVKEGDEVTRVLGGVPMKLKVTKVAEKTVECGPWTFDKATGAEIDEELGWGPPPKGTGSYLKELLVIHKGPDRPLFTGIRP